MYRRLLGPELLRLAPLGAYNVHPSLLPRYRGRCPVSWVLIHGETETGVTLHDMTAEADAGDIVAQRRLTIAPDETSQSLHHRLVPLFVAVIRDTLPAIAAGTAPRAPQDERQASTFGGRGPDDGAFDWTWSAVRIERLVRAVTRPYPGAFARFEGRRLFVWRAALRSAPPGPPGTAGVVGGELVVTTGDGGLALHEWQLGADEDPEGHARFLRRAREGTLRI